MELENNGEQPELTDNVPVADAKIEDSTPSSESNGSLGKFKDAESLLNAYNNLQAEFTRKCQKLSELEKMQQSQTQAQTEQTQVQSQPIYSNENWHDKVNEFLLKNKDAKNFASQISQEILSNPSLQNKEDALEIAWAKVIQKNYKNPKDVLYDDNFVNDYVLSNPQLQEKILSKYIKDRQNNKVPPMLSASTGGSIAFTNQPKATTLSEAKKLVEAIFKN